MHVRPRAGAAVQGWVKDGGGLCERLGLCRLCMYAVCVCMIDSMLDLWFQG